MFDEVVVGVVNQPTRKQTTLFTAEERRAFIADAVARTGLDNVRVEIFSILVVEPRPRARGDGDRQGAAGDLRLRVRV